MSNDFIDVQGIDQQSEREWNASPEVRMEFIDLEGYKAYKRAEARGQFKIQGQGQSNPQRKS